MFTLRSIRDDVTNILLVNTSGYIGLLVLLHCKKKRIFRTGGRPNSSFADLSAKSWCFNAFHYYIFKQTTHVWHVVSGPVPGARGELQGLELGWKQYAQLTDLNKQIFVWYCIYFMPIYVIYLYGQSRFEDEGLVFEYTWVGLSGGTSSRRDSIISEHNMGTKLEKKLCHLLFSPKNKMENFFLIMKFFTRFITYLFNPTR